jgi:parvulin-like peptidyl-prolyl isomerase
MRKLFVIVFLLVSFAGASHGAVVDRIVAVVNNEIITLSELNHEAEPFIERVEQSYKGTEKGRVIEETRKNVLNRMIDGILVKQEAKRLNIVVKDADVTNMLNEMLKSRKMTMEQFKEMLAKDGLSLESYMEEAKDHLVRGRLANREIRSKIMVTDQEIGEYYKQHREDYEGREQVKLRQIVILCPATAPVEKKRECRAEIDSIMASLKAGEKFEVLAAKYSPQLGGEMGFVEKGAMLQPVEDVAFKLKVGEISDIVESPAGYHIIQLLDRRGAGIKSLQSVREEILNKLTLEKSEKKFEEWMTDLRKKSHIEIRL